MFVKFDCGCVGMIVNEERYVLNACDREFNDNEIALSLHHNARVEDKTYVPLPSSETLELLGKIGGLISDGYRFREIQRLLR